MQARSVLLLTMQARFGAIASALVMWLAPASAAALGAGPGRCLGPDVHVEAGLDERWTAIVSDLDERLSSLTDVDRCARVVVAPQGAGVNVRVVLPDGRDAARHVERPELLLKALEALVVLPPPAAEREARTEPRARAAYHEPEASEPAHLEVGVAGCGRIASSPATAVAGGAMHVQVAVDGWLLGLSGRWDGYEGLLSQSPPAGFSRKTVALSALLGRRFTPAGANVDLLVGPELLSDTEEAGSLDEESDRTAGDTRLAAMLRASGPARSAIRGFGALDIDASPSRLHQQRRQAPGLPTLPSWSVGVTLGLLWGIR